MAAELQTPEQMDFNAMLFPGRKVLYVGEVAERLDMSEQQVRDLIDEGKLHAVDVGSGGRKFWRIPMTAFERFLKTRSSLSEPISNGKKFSQQSQ